MWSTDVVLDGQFYYYGYEYVTQMLNSGKVTIEDVVFPKLTKCSVWSYGSSGTLQTQDFMCVLGASYWYSRMFVVLWWWYLLALLWTLLAALCELWQLRQLSRRLSKQLSENKLSND